MRKIAILIFINIFFLTFSSIWCEELVECPACGFKNNKYFSFCVKCGARLSKPGEVEKSIKNLPKILRSPFTPDSAEPDMTKFFITMTYKGNYNWMKNRVTIYIDRKKVGMGKLWKEMRDSHGRGNPFRIRKYIFEGSIEVGIHDIRIEVPYSYRKIDREKIHKISVEEFRKIRFSLMENKKLERIVLIGEKKI